MRPYKHAENIFFMNLFIKDSKGKPFS